MKCVLLSDSKGGAPPQGPGTVCREKCALPSSASSCIITHASRLVNIPIGGGPCVIETVPDEIPGVVRHVFLRGPCTLCSHSSLFCVRGVPFFRPLHVELPVRREIISNNSYFPVYRQTFMVHGYYIPDGPESQQAFRLNRMTPRRPACTHSGDVSGLSPGTLPIRGWPPYRGGRGAKKV